MNLNDFLHSSWFSLAILPFLIFIARICDVTLDTIRIIFVTRGLKFIAPLLGFFQVLIWVTAVAQVMNHQKNWVIFLAYAAGFAAGNYVGICIENKLAVGNLIIRIIADINDSRLIEAFHRHGFNYTQVEAFGNDGPVHIFFTVIKRSNLEQAIRLIQQYNPNAFYSVQDVRYASDSLITVNRPMDAAYTEKQKGKL